jgi:hypothetical protein
MPPTTSVDDLVACFFADFGEDEAAGRAHDDVRELDDADPGERELARIDLAHAAVAGANPFGSPASAR